MRKDRNAIHVNIIYNVMCIHVMTGTRAMIDLAVLVMVPTQTAVLVMVLAQTAVLVMVPAQTAVGVGM